MARWTGKWLLRREERRTQRVAQAALERTVAMNFPGARVSWPSRDGSDLVIEGVERSDFDTVQRIIWHHGWSPERNARVLISTDTQPASLPEWKITRWTVIEPEEVEARRLNTALTRVGT